jgi:hypothetical protein
MLKLVPRNLKTISPWEHRNPKLPDRKQDDQSMAGNQGRYSGAAPERSCEVDLTS